MASFLDRAKDAAQQARVQAEKLAQQGQAKVSEFQETRTEGGLYRALGEAVYAERRKGGSAQAVETAIAALDQHFADDAGPGAPSAPGTPAV